MARIKTAIFTRAELPKLTRELARLYTDKNWGDWVEIYPAIHRGKQVIVANLPSHPRRRKKR